MDNTNNNNNNNENNIHFFINEDEDQDSNINPCHNDSSSVDLIKEFIMNFENDDTSILNDYSNFEQYNFGELPYYIKKIAYNGCEEIYYEENYKIKDLLKICEYYKIDKYVKTLKLKKETIISTIVHFEKLPENQKIVYNRNLMWAYMEELLKDSNMKKYLLWN
jgi:hypothetical protein